MERIKELKLVSNQQLIGELITRMTKHQIEQGELFQLFNLPLENQIKDYEIVDLSKLNKIDLKKAYQDLDKDKNYQAEIKL